MKDYYEVMSVSGGEPLSSGAILQADYEEMGVESGTDLFIEVGHVLTSRIWADSDADAVKIFQAYISAKMIPPETKNDN